MKQSNYMILLIIILGAALWALTGCDKYTRYKLSTFFFTGVPHPAGNINYVPRETERDGKSLEPEEKDNSSTSVHGPYAAERCYLCHEVFNSRRIGTSGFKRPQQEQKKQRFDTGLPGRLLAPVNKLCVECHTSKSMEWAYSRNLWIHGPVSSGMCTICHEPHASRYRYLLRQGNSGQMCATCHEKEFIMASEDHLTGEECTNCHNAHFGKTRFLLKKEFTEIH